VKVLHRTQRSSAPNPLLSSLRQFWGNQQSMVNDHNQGSKALSPSLDCSAKTSDLCWHPPRPPTLVIRRRLHPSSNYLHPATSKYVDYLVL
jgi:hypothetical protein